MTIIQVGDKIKFSTELLTWIHARPKHQSELVTVIKIEDDQTDGSKIVIVQRDDEQSKTNE